MRATVTPSGAAEEEVARLAARLAEAGVDALVDGWVS